MIERKIKSDLREQGSETQSSYLAFTSPPPTGVHHQHQHQNGLRFSEPSPNQGEQEVARGRDAVY